MRLAVGMGEIMGGIQPEIAGQVDELDPFR